MATVHGTLKLSLPEAKLRTQYVAEDEGWALVESDADVLVFKKGVSLRSWGSRLSVEFDASSPSETLLTISMDETVDAYGRGSRAARRLLKLLDATEN
ncbi:MAG TPA: hypothetical protein VGH56_12390 [Solirubrobacteraceae bacterium]